MIKLISIVFRIWRRIWWCCCCDRLIIQFKFNQSLLNVIVFRIWWWFWYCCSSCDRFQSFNSMNIIFSIVCFQQHSVVVLVRQLRCLARNRRSVVTKYIFIIRFSFLIRFFVTVLFFFRWTIEM